MQSKGSSSVIYKQIYQELKNDIENGKYLSGSLIPTEAQLMEKYRVSRTTVRRAIALLKADGLVRVNQGRGAEVLKGRSQVRRTEFHIAHDVNAVSARYLKEGESSSSSSIVDIVQADTRIAEALEIEPLSQVYRIQRLKLRGGVPFDYVVSYVPCDVAPNLERFSGRIFWLSKCLNDEYGIVSTEVSEEVYAGNVSFLEASLLHVPVNSAVMIVCRISRNEKGVIEFTESHLRPDIFHICLSMSGKPDYLSTDEEQGNNILALLS